VGEEITIKFPVPGNVPKWTLSSITQAGTKRQIIADEPSDAGEATPNRNFTAVPVTPRRTSKARGRLLIYLMTELRSWFTVVKVGVSNLETDLFTNVNKQCPSCDT